MADILKELQSISLWVEESAKSLVERSEVYFLRLINFPQTDDPVANVVAADTEPVQPIAEGSTIKKSSKISGSKCSEDPQPVLRSSKRLASKNVEETADVLVKDSLSTSLKNCHGTKTGISLGGRRSSRNKSLKKSYAARVTSSKNSTVAESFEDPIPEECAESCSATPQEVILRASQEKSFEKLMPVLETHLVVVAPEYGSKIVGSDVFSSSDKNSTLTESLSVPIVEKCAATCSSTPQENNLRASEEISQKSMPALKTFSPEYGTKSVGSGASSTSGDSGIAINKSSKGKSSHENYEKTPEVYSDNERSGYSTNKKAAAKTPASNLNGLTASSTICVVKDVPGTYCVSANKVPRIIQITEDQASSPVLRKSPRIKLHQLKASSTVDNTKAHEPSASNRKPTKVAKFKRSASHDVLTTKQIRVGSPLPINRKRLPSENETGGRKRHDSVRKKPDEAVAKKQAMLSSMVTEKKQKRLMKEQRNKELKEKLETQKQMKQHVLFDEETRPKKPKKFPSNYYEEQPACQTKNATLMKVQHEKRVLTPTNNQKLPPTNLRLQALKKPKTSTPKTQMNSTFVCSTNKENMNQSMSEMESFVNYDMSGFRQSDEEEEEYEPEPAKRIPGWASGIRLREAVLQQEYDPVDPEAILAPFENSINGVFSNNERLKRRTSSAVWTATP